MEAAIIDTGVWYAMFDGRDANRQSVKEKEELLSFLTITIPWPTAYETLRTRFVRNSVALRQFELFLQKPNIEFVDDDGFRERALRLAFDSSLRRGRPLSMVDCLIRLMLNDRNIRVSYLATFNKADFLDVCLKNRIEII